MPAHPEIRSEEIQDIMHRTPNWLTSWGITVLLAIVVLVLTGASYIAYPDTATADVVVELRSKPITITAPASATIDQILIRNHLPIVPGTPILTWTNGDTLRASIAGTAYVMVPPGTVSELMPNEVIAILVPSNGPYRVRGHLPVSGAGKVRIGQQVSIQLDAYPHREFGSLPAVVETVSPVDVNGHYEIRFALQNGLVTQTGHRIDGRISLRGKATILTNERSMLSRIFDIL